MEQIRLPTTWIAHEIFPHQEGTHCEFKLSENFHGAQAMKCAKYWETLFAFINVGGGYLILGVHDKGEIIGCNDVTPKKLDQLRNDIDNRYRRLCYRDGSPITPNSIMIEVESYPVMQYNRLTGKECVVVKVNSHKRLMDVQTVDGLVFYRLSASNYRLPTERIYRNGEVQGLVRSIQMQFEEVIRTQHATIKQLQEKHKEELHTLLEEERKKAIALTSEILYKAHRTMPESASQEDRPKWWEFWTRCFGWAAGYTDADDVSETSSEIVDPKPQDPSPLADLEELPSNNTEPLASPS